MLSDKIAAWMVTLCAVAEAVAAFGGAPRDPWSVASYAALAAYFAWLDILVPSRKKDEA